MSMNGFLRWYRWGLGMKYHMGIYTVGLIFCKGVVNALMGEYEVDSLTMLEMLIGSLLFASVETALFPGGLDQPQPRGRTALWAALGNLLYVGGALALGWFRGIPRWGGLVLILILEAGLFAMWFGINVAMQADTADLNRRLRDYQQE